MPVGIIGVLMPQFGFTVGGGGAAPNTPTLTCLDNKDGTATVTIVGSSGGSANEVYTQQGFPGSYPQVDQGGCTGDGSVSFSISAGVYYVVVHSTLNNQTAMTIIYLLVVGSYTTDLTHSPANIVRWLLVNAAQATTPISNGLWPAFHSSEPNMPDNCITVYNNGTGLVQGTTNTDNEIQEHYGIQVKVRSSNPETCYSKMQALCNYMDRQVNASSVTVSDDYGTSTYVVHALTRVGTIMDLGKDVSEGKRNTMTANYNASIIALS